MEMNSEEKDKNDVNQKTNDNVETNTNVEEKIDTQPDQKGNEDINLTADTAPTPEPKKVEHKIKHPKTDVVHYEDPELDSNWGWAIEFPSVEPLETHWNKLKTFLEQHEHPLKGKVSWLSLDPRGYFSPRIRHFIAFTGWGIQIENLPDWYKEHIIGLEKPAKSIEASEELADGNWQGYIVKEKIELKGPEFIKLDSFSRNKRKTVEEAKKPISSKLPRFWCQKSLYTARDYLIPVITEEKYNSGEKSAVTYLEEYIVEQLDWKEAGQDEMFVILPSEFTFDENVTRKIKIPEEYTPEINYDYPGMFPGGMGGLGGLGGMDGMPDFSDMPEMGDEGLDDLVSDEPDEQESDVIDEDSEEKNDAIDAEVVPDDK